MQYGRTGRLKASVRLFLTLLCVSPAFAAPESGSAPFEPSLLPALRRSVEQKKLWEDPYWRKLLYYERGWLGGYHSVCINKDFFLSPEGKTNPRAEMEAAVSGFFSPGPDNDSPECRFPERYNWLRRVLGGDAQAVPARVCSDYEEWKAGLETESVSLIFAAGYLNNPSTLYGHTFLRLHRRGANGADLLDYTINYAATADAENGILFALKGLVGAYPGQFSTIPYYLKIQEYHNLENRDLWEFPLSLTSEEIDRLLRHGWELGKASFPYLFFTRNCSWQLLPLLDIAKPELAVSARFPRWVIPSDTTKAIVSASPAAKVQWRPALWKTVEWKRSQLTEGERDLSFKLARGDQPAAIKKLSALPPARAATVLEATADYLSWRLYARQIGKDELDGRSDPLLSVRASLGPQTTFTGAPPMPVSVMEAHDSMRLGAGFVGIRDSGPAYELQGRFAIQDLLDSPDGYLPDAALEMASLRLRWLPDRKRFYFKEARLAHVLSLNPWDNWVRRKSWEINAGLEQAEETGRQTGTSAIWSMNAASGFAAETRVGARELFYLMATADSGLGPALDKSWRLGAGLKAGMLAEAGPVRALAEARYIGYALGSKTSLWTGSLSASVRLARDSAVRAEYSWRGPSREAGVYFQQFVFPP